MLVNVFRVIARWKTVLFVQMQDAHFVGCQQSQRKHQKALFIRRCPGGSGHQSAHVGGHAPTIFSSSARDLSQPCKIFCLCSLKKRQIKVQMV